MSGMFCDEDLGGELKICVKCKHCFVTHGGYMCRRPRPGAGVDPVTGETEKKACIKERTEDDPDLCGFDAQFWEEKKKTSGLRVEPFMGRGL